MDTGTVVIEPVIDYSQMTDDQILALTQHKRVTIVQHLTRAPGGIPGDKEDRDALFKSLDGLDKIALTRKRIQADQETTAGVTQAVGVITQLLRQSKLNYNTVDVEDVDASEMPKLGDDVPAPILVPGETEINAPQLDYDSFVAGRQAAA